MARRVGATARVQTDQHPAHRQMSEGRSLMLASPLFAKAAPPRTRQERGGWHGRCHAQNWIRSLERYALPRIGGRSISEMNTAGVLEIFTPISRLLLCVPRCSPWRSSPRVRRSRLHATGPLGVQGSITAHAGGYLRGRAARSAVRAARRHARTGLRRELAAQALPPVAQRLRDADETLANDTPAAGAYAGDVEGWLKLTGYAGDGPGDGKRRRPTWPRRRSSLLGTFVRGVFESWFSTPG